MTAAVYWFRNDLRLTDNPALDRACREADELTLVYVRNADEATSTRWNFPRWSSLRRGFRDGAVDGLAGAIAEKGGSLLQVDGAAVTVLIDLAGSVGARRVYCEDIPAP